MSEISRHHVSALVFSGALLSGLAGCKTLENPQQGKVSESSNRISLNSLNAEFNHATIYNGFFNNRYINPKYTNPHSRDYIALPGPVLGKLEEPIQFAGKYSPAHLKLLIKGNVSQNPNLQIYINGQIQLDIQSVKITTTKSNKSLDIEVIMPNNGSMSTYNVTSIDAFVIPVNKQGEIEPNLKQKYHLLSNFVGERDLGLVNSK